MSKQEQSEQPKRSSEDQKQMSEADLQKAAGGIRIVMRDLLVTS
jgi:hypothetical protein